MTVNECSQIRCHVDGCTFSQGWSTTPAAKAASAWHVFEAHPTVWEEIIGPRTPIDPRPETIGFLLPG